MDFCHFLVRNIFGNLPLAKQTEIQTKILVNTVMWYFQITNSQHRIIMILKSLGIAMDLVDISGKLEPSIGFFINSDS